MYLELWECSNNYFFKYFLYRNALNNFFNIQEYHRIELTKKNNLNLRFRNKMNRKGVG